MTDRYYALTVVLANDTRDDDAQPIIDAIKMIKGVLEVKPRVVDTELWAAESRAKREIEQKLWNALRG